MAARDDVSLGAAGRCPHHQFWDMTAEPAYVVNLVQLRSACAPLIGCYERALAGRSVGLGDLDRAVARLARLPALPGRLGRAVKLLAIGGRSATTAETIEALELLRSTPALRPRSVPAPCPPAVRARQGALPGL